MPLSATKLVNSLNIASIVIFIVTIHAIALKPISFFPEVNTVVTNSSIMPATMDDIINFMKQSEAARSLERASDKEALAEDRAQDKKERTEEIAHLKESISGLIKSGVKEEVESAMKPIQEAQSSLTQDHVKLSQTVSSLQEQLASLQAGNKSLDKNVTISAPAIETNETPQVLADLFKRKESKTAKIVRTAKKIIGFSPISKEHIEHAKVQYDIEDEFEAKKAAVKDLLYFEMKIPVSRIKAMKMKRVFPPLTNQRMIRIVSMSNLKKNPQSTMSTPLLTILAPKSSYTTTFLIHSLIGLKQWMALLTTSEMVRATLKQK